MIYLNTSGSAYEIGVQHGCTCPEAIRLAYQAFGQRSTTSVPQSQIDASVRSVEGRLQRVFPQTLEEMRGIAESARVSCREVLLRNGASALLRPQPNRGCSTIGFADSDAGVLLGKTADWAVQGAERFAVWQRYQPGDGEGLAFIHYTAAGMIWSEGGLNAAGVGMVLNALPGVVGSSREGVPTTVLDRGVLQRCHTVQDAIDFLGQHDVMCCGFNVMLADASGDLAFVEVVPGNQAVRRIDEDYLIHTNHCLCPETARRQTHVTDNSIARYQTLQSIVPPAPRTLAGMMTLLRYHSGPGAISHVCTVFAIIVAPAQGRIWGANGYPPAVPFVEYQLQ